MYNLLYRNVYYKRLYEELSECEKSQNFRINESSELSFTDENSNIKSFLKLEPYYVHSEFGNAKCVPNDVVRCLNSAIGVANFRFPHLSKLLSSFNIIILPKYSNICRTMGVNSESKTLVMCAAFVANELSYDYKNIAVIILHETLHIFLNHKKREDNYKKNHKDYISYPNGNIAMDYEVNQILINERICKPEFFTEIVPGCYNKEYEGMIWENIYPICNNKIPVLDSSITPKQTVPLEKTELEDDIDELAKTLDKMSEKDELGKYDVKDKEESGESPFKIKNAEESDIFKKGYEDTANELAKIYTKEGPTAVKIRVSEIISSLKESVETDTDYKRGRAKAATDMLKELFGDRQQSGGSDEESKESDKSGSDEESKESDKSGSKGTEDNSDSSSDKSGSKGTEDNSDSSSDKKTDINKIKDILEKLSNGSSSDKVKKDAKDILDKVESGKLTDEDKKDIASKLKDIKKEKIKEIEENVVNSPEHSEKDLVGKEIDKSAFNDMSDTGVDTSEQGKINEIVSKDRSYEANEKDINSIIDTGSEFGKLINKIKNTGGFDEVNWQLLLKRLLKNRTKGIGDSKVKNISSQNEYPKRSRLWDYKNVILPQHKVMSTKQQPLVLAIDVSGSVSWDNIMKFISYSILLFKKLRYSSIEVYLVGSRVVGPFKYSKNDDEIKWFDNIQKKREFAGTSTENFPELYKDVILPYSYKTKNPVFLVFGDGDWAELNQALYKQMESKADVLFAINLRRGGNIPPYIDRFNLLIIDNI